MAFSRCGAGSVGRCTTTLPASPPPTLSLSLSLLCSVALSIGLCSVRVLRRLLIYSASVLDALGLSGARHDRRSFATALSMIGACSLRRSFAPALGRSGARSLRRSVSVALGLCGARSLGRVASLELCVSGTRPLWRSAGVALDLWGGVPPLCWPLRRPLSLALGRFGYRALQRSGTPALVDLSGLGV